MFSINEFDNEIKPEFSVGVSKYKNMMGVTCYMNSILHILQQIPSFMEYILQAKFRNTIIKKIGYKKIQNPELNTEDFLKNFVIFELFRLFKTSHENDDSIITPTTFKTLIGEKNDMWNEYNHQDSQEFFNFLISQLEEEVGMKTEFIPGFNTNLFDKLNSIDYNIDNILSTISTKKYYSKEYSPLINLFNGMTENNKKCMCCNSKSIGFEPFLTLGLSVPIKNKQDMERDIDIYECLNNLVLEEQLDINNKINCGLCGLKNRAYSKTLLWKTPQILVLHIKRFLVNSFGIPTQKINNNIIYPVKNLDLSKYFNQNSPYKNQSKYNLIGVNIHKSFGTGENINYGHYVSFVQNIINKKWYFYNDSNPLQVITNDGQLQNSDAYLLFYYRE